MYMDANPRVHEYTHPWVKALMDKNPNAWGDIKKVLKGGET